MTHYFRSSFTINRIHIVCIAVLLAILHIKAISGLFSATLAISNYLFVVSLSFLSISLLRKLNDKLAVLATILWILFLLTELIINQLTGLHLNSFVFASLLQQATNSSMAFVSYLITAIAIVTLVYFLQFYNLPRRKQNKISIKYGHVIGALFASLTCTQAIYAIGYYFGELETVYIKRKLSILVTPHPYYIKKGLSILFEPSTDNPFARSRSISERQISDGTLSEATLDQRTNILIIIADSLRGQDIMKTPSLAPNIATWSYNLKFRSFNHYSTSNCTHFSIYSLLSGQLPTNFSSARKAPVVVQPIQTLISEGYQISTSEAETLDWYDTASTVYAGQANRHIVPSKQPNKDEMAIVDSLNKIQQYQAKKQPFFHVTYLSDTHFPYTSSTNKQNKSIYEQYLSAIKEVDNNIGFYLGELKSTGALDDTLVIITSDHGEELLENGIIGHSSRLSPEQVKVPLVIISPVLQDNTQWPKSHIDIMPYALSSLSLSAKTIDDNNSIILANCDYDYPNGFAVITDQSRTDFIFEDGFLYNAQTPYSRSTTINREQATKTLLETLSD
ncbi:sulfatase-like hydrolase/transferase [Kordiimonas sp. SCSIO 12610]|uniref:sulfatase-like hydrolase/transferase n=1 Tax=Kordiimonas sp. SCSIO 12610 TaxID=2829597 RepID=UPI00210AA353|nr:sulfatase-like hydrolase/transferase [Kordiimonas sp. SCSIO 12610]UTW54828.1 sulfatase-like hydrolase/transferase [Kordiimonas sp. SCSIO 12610]